jgi:hypothetical protein
MTIYLGILCMCIHRAAICPRQRYMGRDYQISGCPTLMSKCKVSTGISSLPKCKTEISWISFDCSGGPKPKLRALKSIRNSAQPKAHLISWFSSYVSTSMSDHPIFDEHWCGWRWVIFWFLCPKLQRLDICSVYNTTIIAPDKRQISRPTLITIKFLAL